MSRSRAAAIFLGLAALAGAPTGALAAGDCCGFAGDVAAAIAELAAHTDAFLAANAAVPASRGALLLKSLQKAEEAMASGLDEGGACDGARARLRFQSARSWLASYRQVLADVQAQDSPLDGAAFYLGARIEGLIAGVCEDGPALPLR